MPRRKATKNQAADAALLPLVPLLVTELSLTSGRSMMRSDARSSHAGSSKKCGSPK